MKNILAAAVAAAALLTSVAFAETKQSGQVSAGYVFNDLDLGATRGDTDRNGANVIGQVAIPLTRGLAIQLDGEYTYFDSDESGGASDDDDDSVSGTVHLFRRDNRYLIGAFGGAASINGDNTYGGGLEGQWYPGERWTIGWRASYITQEDTEIDVYGGDAFVRFFFTENWSLQGGAGAGGINVDETSIGDEDDGFIWNVNARSEWRPTWRFPVSLYAGVRYSSSDDVNIDDLAATVGLTWNFGQETLRSRDLTGASLTPFTSNFPGSAIR